MRTLPLYLLRILKGASKFLEDLWISDPTISALYSQRLFPNSGSAERS
jgi:hypothetical protein